MERELHSHHETSKGLTLLRLRSHVPRSCRHTEQITTRRAVIPETVAKASSTEGGVTPSDSKSSGSASAFLFPRWQATGVFVCLLPPTIASGYKPHRFKTKRLVHHFRCSIHTHIRVGIMVPRLVQPLLVGFPRIRIFSERYQFVSREWRACPPQTLNHLAFQGITHCTWQAGGVSTLLGTCR